MWGWLSPRPGLGCSGWGLYGLLPGSERFLWEEHKVASSADHGI